MTQTIDITHHVIGDDNQFLEIKEWLVENVGPLKLAIPTCRTGDGWDIRYETVYNEEYKANVYKMKLDFEHQSHAVMFRLVWP